LAGLAPPREPLPLLAAFFAAFGLDCDLDLLDFDDFARFGADRLFVLVCV
jgi:hypothetical protein